MPSPAKDGSSGIPSLLPASTIYPASPSGHRGLRKLQSAHNLGAKAGNLLPSMISQQRLLQHQHLQHHQQQQAQQQLQAQQQRSASPVRRNVSGTNRSPQRARANSDATLALPLGASATTSASAANSVASANRKALLGRSPALDALSIDRLIRDGPPDGDVVGALNNLRWKILETGIKSDSDGMVSPMTCPHYSPEEC